MTTNNTLEHLTPSQQEVASPSEGGGGEGDGRGVAGGGVRADGVEGDIKVGLFQDGCVWEDFFFLLLLYFFSFSNFWSHFRAVNSTGKEDEQDLWHSRSKKMQMWTAGQLDGGTEGGMGGRRDIVQTAGRELWTLSWKQPWTAARWQISGPVCPLQQQQVHGAQRVRRRRRRRIPNLFVVSATLLTQRERGRRRESERERGGERFTSKFCQSIIDLCENLAFS